MTQYRFTQDFPPTDWKKGNKIHGGSSRTELALMLKLGVIEEVKEEEEITICPKHHCDSRKCDECLPQNDWEWRFGEEFGIHFKEAAGELQFALEFICREKEKSFDEGCESYKKANL